MPALQLAPLQLAVVVPVFNEAANVAEMVRRLDAALAGRVWEAIFVDDDSPDGTADAVRAIGADRHPRAGDPAARPARAVDRLYRGDVRDRRARSPR